nr:hypothetical protein [uncultured Clostridium sp.]
MFDVKKMYTNYSGTRFLCDCPCDSEKTAKYIEISFLLSVRECYRFANLYVKDSTLILDTPDKEKTKALIFLLNNSIANMH